MHKTIISYKLWSNIFIVQYIALLMDWIEATINNEDIFPTTPGNSQEYLIAIYKETLTYMYQWIFFRKTRF